MVLSLDPPVVLLLTTVSLLLVMELKMDKIITLSKTHGVQTGVLMAMLSLVLRLAPVSVVSRCNLFSLPLTEEYIVIQIKFNHYLMKFKHFFNFFQL